MNYPHLMAKIVNVPLMLYPHAATTIYNVLCGRFGTAPMEQDYGNESYRSIQSVVRASRAALVGPPDGPHFKKQPLPSASRFTGERVKTEDGKFPAVEPYLRTPDGVALITVDGELVNRGAFVGADSGLVSYEGVKFQLARAARDPKARAILLDINSPGGEAIGAEEMAGAVRAAAASKPVYAVANGMAASAAYAMASGATRIFAAPSSVVGSIGVVLLHLDYSQALDKAGIAPTLIFAGAHKTTGNPVEPLSDGAAAELQADVDTFYKSFLSSVAQGRGRRLSVKAARETEARTYIGAAAVSAGLADAVGTFEDALGELSSKVVRASARKVAQARASFLQGVRIMANEAETETETTIREAADKANREGFRAGLNFAYNRIEKIMADERVKGRESHALKLALKTDMSEDDVCAMCADFPATQAASLAEKVDATGVNLIRSGPAPQETSADSWGKVVSKVNSRSQAGRAA
jgi:signal peptide peptidase SppA